MNSTKALIWFKRDLRTSDHAPLSHSARFENAVALFTIEPAWLQSPECDSRHVQFLLACIENLSQELATIGIPLLVRRGEAVEVMRSLYQAYPFTDLLSHEETGPGWSFIRDKAIKSWCRSKQINWLEWAQTGVVRRLEDRRGWAGKWLKLMDSPTIQVQKRRDQVDHLLVEQFSEIPKIENLGLSPTEITLPKAGSTAAHGVLEDFLHRRAIGYRQGLSSPLRAPIHCSRLSPYLAFGCISIRQVHQATEKAMRFSLDRDLTYDLSSFASRLRWHCHFMQKLEDEPEIEFRNFARSHDGLRAGDGAHPESLNLKYLEAWQEGRTGYPMVDACMRQLRVTGWINFRMRAMLVSFAAYYLGLHWREPGIHLARQFLDFEPGIHWSQMQMQSGTTGINTLRIYSPSKQQADQDPQGEFIKHWIPELNSNQYPRPIVDDHTVLAQLKARMYALRKESHVQCEATQIQQRHGSKKSGLSASAGGSKKRISKSALEGSAFSANNPDQLAQGELF